MPHGTLNGLFSLVSDQKSGHDKSKENFKKSVVETAEKHGYTQKKVVNQAKKDTKDVLEKKED